MAVNKALEMERPQLKTLRDYLAANPSKWRPGTIPGQTPRTDPLLATVDHLLATLDLVIKKPETKANVPELARLMALAKQDTERLANAGLGTITIANTTDDKRELPLYGDYFRKGYAFSKLREHIEMAFQWYDRLAFYLTPEGKDYLKSVVEVRSEGEGAELKLHLFEHKFHENINPIVGENWDYLNWAAGLAKQNEDPLDYVVDKLLQNSPKILFIDPDKSRLSTTGDLRGSILVRVLSHVAGNEQYGAPGGPPRMWTFQVKVAKSSIDPGVQWSPLIDAKHAVGLPTLRVVNSETTNRHVGSDFTAGTIYAMDGPAHMYCYPPIAFHSALMSGEPITAAGILVVENGRVIAVDNRSGHYQPGYMQLKFAVDYLQTNQLFEPEAFVSLYLDNSDAMYFSPADFIAVAGAGLPYPLVAAKLAERVKKYQGLPVTMTFHERLLPSQLKFPSDSKGRLARWDRMLLKLYSPPGVNLKSLVNDLSGLLEAQLRTPWQSAKPGVNAPGYQSQSSRQAAGAGGISPANAQRRLADGGAYCELIPLIDGLTKNAQTSSKNQPQAGRTITAYQTIQTRLFNLRPAETIMTG